MLLLCGIGRITALDVQGMEIMTHKEFSIEPASTATYLAIAGIILVAIVPLVFTAVHFFRKSERLTIPMIVLFLIVTVVVIVCGFFVYFGYSARWGKFVVADGGLQIKGCLYGRAIPQDSINKERIKIVNLITEQSYRTVARTNGIGLPGYLAGWFRLKNGDKALLFVTRKTDVVYIPTSEGYCVLLSPSEPIEFLKVTQQTWNDSEASFAH